MRCAGVVGARSGFQSGLLERDPLLANTQTASVGISLASRRGIPFGIMTAVILLRFGPADLRVRDDAIAAQPAEVLERRPALVGVAIEELLHAAGSAP